jgi:hypothetical protein
MSDSEGFSLSFRGTRRALVAMSGLLIMAVSPAYAGISSDDCISAVISDASLPSSTDSHDADAGAPVLSGSTDTGTPVAVDGDGQSGIYTQASGYGQTNS